PEGSVQRIILEVEARQARWDFDTRYALKPFVEAQNDVRENFRILTSEHRGTNPERLNKLPTGRAKEINEGIDNFLSQFPGMNKTQVGRFKDRILTQVLDAESGKTIYDAGRQLTLMFDIAPVSRKIQNAAYDALRTLTTKGSTPTPTEIAGMRKALDHVLGAGTTSQLLNARRWTIKGGELVINTIGLPRAIMASSDGSAILRQSAGLGARMPVQWLKMVGRTFKSFFNPNFADDVRASIVKSGVVRLEGGEVVEMHTLARKVELFLASDASQLGLTFKEEEWMTSFASKWGWHLPRDSKGHLSAKLWDLEKVPFPIPLAQSERAYVVGLDKLRMDYFSNEVGRMIRHGMANGRPPAMRDFEQLALWVNNNTGRGKLLERLRSINPILNTVFFAPR
ncbi:hypothetical protein LCGC14_2853920, partial [marine sediment metagenome]